ncbi:hypothetical protein FOZ62_004951 [Perkinsus olseni]|uniref:Uncharacterized protein n=1 Tax=Perkinsus olseni TaxID=32597 RepID=A0A7J6PY15_PEROL|nr:hypothetical protein FOZ62_004951 [Perkinsus olseni]
MADSESSGTRSAEISLPLYITALSLTASIVVFGVNVGISKILLASGTCICLDLTITTVVFSILIWTIVSAFVEMNLTDCLLCHPSWVTHVPIVALSSRHARKGSDLLLQDELRGHHADLSSRLGKRHVNAAPVQVAKRVACRFKSENADYDIRGNLSPPPVLDEGLKPFELAIPGSWIAMISWAFLTMPTCSFITAYDGGRHNEGLGYSSWTLTWIRTTFIAIQTLLLSQVCALTTYIYHTHTTEDPYSRSRYPSFVSTISTTDKTLSPSIARSDSKDTTGLGEPSPRPLEGIPEEEISSDVDGEHES